MNTPDRPLDYSCELRALDETNPLWLYARVLDAASGEEVKGVTYANEREGWYTVYECVRLTPGCENIPEVRYDHPIRIEVKLDGEWRPLAEVAALGEAAVPRLGSKRNA